MTYNIRDYIVDSIHKSYIPETFKYLQNRKYMSYGRNNLFIWGKMPSPNVGGSTIGFAAFAYGLPQGSLSRFKDSSSTSYYSVHPRLLSAIP